MIKASENIRPAVASVFPAARSNPLGGRLIQVALSFYQVIAAVSFAAALLLGISWLRTPFIGAFFENSLLFNRAAPTADAEEWDLYSQGVHPGDQLVSVNGIQVQSTSQVQGILAGFFPGESIPVGVRTAAGEERTYEVRLNAFPIEDRTAYFILPAISSFLFLAISLLIFGMRRMEAAGRAFAVLAASLSIVSGSLFDVFTTHALTYLWTLALALTSAALIHLGLVFPRETRIAIRWPLVQWLAYVAGLVVAAYALSGLASGPRPSDSVSASTWIYAFAALCLLAYVLLNLYYSIGASSPVVKTQARMILVGLGIAFGPLAAWLLLSAQRPTGFTPYTVLPVVLFPLTLGYTVLRFRFVQADDVARQGLIYVLLSVFIIGAYALIVTGLSLIFKTAMPTTSPFWIGGLVFLLAVVLDPIRLRLQSFVDRTFFRGQRAYAEIIQSFTHDLTAALGLREIGGLLRGLITSTLAPSSVHVYIFDSLNDQFTALPDDSGRPSTDVRFASGGALAHYFAAERLPLYLDETSLPTELRSEQSRLALLGARLFMVLPARERPVGWLALGPRLSGQPYAPRDLSFLERLADQASVAIQRVQTVSNLERRVQEMNALTRVSQGVNVTLTFDDVLELIYAQTSQTIPISHFYITLYNRDLNYFYLGFAVEDNDRSTSRENRPLAGNVDLAPEVIRRGRPFLTSDYVRECQSRGLAPITNGLAAWMGVPLNAGAESLGALVVATRDPGTTFTSGQLDLLQAIADQTAGAIVKAQLLRETQQRASQLGKLNEVTRQLASTLELTPLLQNIVEGAASILDCEAGLFYAIDETSGDLVVRATAGPISRDLLGQHIALTDGAAARAARSHNLVVDNDVDSSVEGGQGTAIPGFLSRASLAIPLRVKDSNVGVLEILNRRDGLPFVKEDETVLAAFAGQAAVAIENVRLYTLTDQELAARVEELSVMQRIDRELNASLELQRAMRITLDWAMRQSTAEAGLIGMLEEGQLRVVAQAGFGEGSETTVEQSLALTLPGFQSAVDTGLPQRTDFASGGGRGFLPASDHQIIVPIRREASVIGLLVLESTRSSQEDLAFLSRLTDHAAIAIANAQLYDEVQRANVAKSDFVSLVAHELKNPMTSIKGYTELLAAGAVGPVNEMQANFLNTIRSNTERMSTLVSDLNDNSKIEAGRLRLDFKSVELGDLVDEMVRSTRRQIDEKKQTITLELPPQLPRVWADHTRLGQVFINLISNANKYTPEGGSLVIGGEESANHWDPGGAKRVVHIWVRDTGIGISPEDEQKIFQKFFRSEDPKARESPGAGLGLNITRSLVEMQGGRIWFESQYRQGTTFHFTVPVAEG